MTRAAALMIALAFCLTANATEGAPSEQVLAQMGLADLQILSDSEAMAIRGSGFEPWEFPHSSKFANVRDSIDDFHHNVKDFHKNVRDFHHNVKDFKSHSKSKHNFNKSKHSFHKTKHSAHKSHKQKSHSKAKVGKVHHKSYSYSRGKMAGGYSKAG